MAVEKMSTVTVLVVVCALAGLCYGENKECSMAQNDMFSKVMACVAKKIPTNNFFDIFIRLQDRKSMTDPDFMCSEQQLMAHAVECMLQYVEGCMPPTLAKQVAEVMPNHQYIRKGIGFLCKHRKDFENQCVKTRLMSVGHCIDSKLKTFSGFSRAASGNMQNALCLVLGQEDKCVDSSLKGCPQEVTSDIKATLKAFFPDYKCPSGRADLGTLFFQSESEH